MKDRHIMYGRMIREIMNNWVNIGNKFSWKFPFIEKEEPLKKCLDTYEFKQFKKRNPFTAMFIERNVKAKRQLGEKKG